MKRIQYYRYGGPGELRLEEVAQPDPGPGQVRVRVKAAAANPMDWKIRKGELKMMTGASFPRGLGHDFAGVVDAVGRGVVGLRIGDAVFGATSLKAAGTFAQALVADAKTVFLKPAALSFEEAAAMPVVSATAWTALIRQAKLRTGQRVLITGCLGGVGRMAVQIAVMRGARVVGSCSASRRDEALALGVHEVVDYATFNPKAYRRAFDVVFDAHGALSLGQCDGMLKRGGVAQYCVPTPMKMLWSLVSRRHQTVFAELSPDTMGPITDMAQEGKLAPTIGQIVPLSGAISAILALEKTASPRGKLVVVPE